MPTEILRRALENKARRYGAENAALLLDKYTVFTEQEDQKPLLREICGKVGDSSTLKQARGSFDSMVRNLTGSVTFTGALKAPMALHLSRANALENAGICLHRTYGFAYLPGTGLKGLARAYAETVAQAVGTDDFRRIFGFEPDGKDNPGSAGEVVFHDALPLSWPKLAVDITNCHYSEYYNGNEPPGDWMNPIPVYYPTVAKGSSFTFALSPRRRGSEALVNKAAEWLAGGLMHLGAGGKTAQGYGVFTVDLPGKPTQLPASTDRATFTCELELVTPAFLAGPNQDQSDCELRGATLRGLLRWWWRTMYAGMLQTKDLRALEQKLWGNTEAGSAITVCVGAQKTNLKPQQYDCKEGWRLKPSFGRQHDLATPPRGTTQGVFYMSYGMNDGGNDKVIRWYQGEGCKWDLTIAARPVGKLSSSEVLEQAMHALWLLTHFGGVGAKSRRGFGSLKTVGTLSIDKCLKRAQALCFSENLKTAEVGQNESPALGSSTRVVEIVLKSSKAFGAIDKLGYVYQKFASSMKHRKEKRALGLPRQIHGPRPSPMGHQSKDTHQMPFQLECSKGKRYASPVFFHVFRNGGEYRARFVAFYSKHLGDWAESNRVLNALADHMQH